MSVAEPASCTNHQRNNIFSPENGRFKGLPFHRIAIGSSGIAFHRLRSGNA